MALIGGLEMQGVAERVEELQKNKTNEGDKKQPKCFICLDSGIILYKKKTIFGYDAEYAAHCTCEAGNRYVYEGRECKEHKSEYRIASIDEVLDKFELAKNNYEQWIAKSREAKANEG